LSKDRQHRPPPPGTHLELLLIDELYCCQPHPLTQCCLVPGGAAPQLPLPQPRQQRVTPRLNKLLSTLRQRCSLATRDAPEPRPDLLPVGPDQHHLLLLLLVLDIIAAITSSSSSSSSGRAFGLAAGLCLLYELVLCVVAEGGLQAQHSTAQHSTAQDRSHRSHRSHRVQPKGPHEGCAVEEGGKKGGELNMVGVGGGWAGMPSEGGANNLYSWAYSCAAASPPPYHCYPVLRVPPPLPPNARTHKHTRAHMLSPVSHLVTHTLCSLSLA